MCAPYRRLLRRLMRNHERLVDATPPDRSGACHNLTHCQFWGDTEMGTAHGSRLRSVGQPRAHGRSTRPWPHEGNATCSTT